MRGYPGAVEGVLRGCGGGVLRGCAGVVLRGCRRGEGQNWPASIRSGSCAIISLRYVRI